MNLLAKLGLTALMSCAAVCHASLLTFEDLPGTATGGKMVPDNYGGFAWLPSSVALSTQGTPQFDGYVSSGQWFLMADHPLYTTPEIVGGPATAFGSATAFDLVGMNLSDVASRANTVQIRGYSADETLLYSVDIAPAGSSTRYDLNFLGVNLVEIWTFPGTPGAFPSIAVDDIEYRGSPVAQGFNPNREAPEPSTVALGAIALLAAGWSRRNTSSRSA